MYPAATPQLPDTRRLASALDLSGLYRSSIFRSAVRTSHHPQLAQLLDSQHEVKWGPGVVDSALFGVEAKRLRLVALRYGPQVTIQPQPFSGFSLVQMPLRGSMQIRQGHQTTRVEVGHAAIIGSDKEVALNWSEDCEQIILRVPHSIFGEVTPTDTIATGTTNSGVLLLDKDSTSTWLSLVQALLDSVKPGSSASPLANSAWVDQIETTLALFTLLQLQGNRHQEALSAKGQTAASQAAQLLPQQFENESAYRMEQVRQYVSRRLGAPLSLEDLARAAGVRPRTVYMDSIRCYGVGPMTWLRNLRLDAAREQIMANPSCNVTDVAMDCGFGHLGRFSAYYRERFNELPSETAKAMQIRA